MPFGKPDQKDAKDQGPPQAEAQHSDMKANDAHDGNHGAHQPNGHATPAQQNQHQAACDANHGAGTGSGSGQDRDGDYDGD